MKGETGYEYLLTYGWAVLIVIVVGVALFALGVFNPEIYRNQTEEIQVENGTVSRYHIEVYINPRNSVECYEKQRFNCGLRLTACEDGRAYDCLHNVIEELRLIEDES